MSLLGLGVKVAIAFLESLIANCGPCSRHFLHLVSVPGNFLHGGKFPLIFLWVRELNQICTLNICTCQSRRNFKVIIPNGNVPWFHIYNELLKDHLRKWTFHQAISHVCQQSLNLPRSKVKCLEYKPLCSHRLKWHLSFCAVREELHRVLVRGALRAKV